MDFFTYIPGKYPLVPFNEYHIAALIVLATVIMLIVVFREKLRDPKVDAIVLKSAAVFGIVMETIFHILNYTNNSDFWVHLAPFELCTISLWLCIALCLTKKKQIFTVLYFFAIGAIAALLFPNNGGLGPDRFRYYHFFGTHSYILLTVIYFAVVHKCRVNVKSLGITFVVLVPVALALRSLDLSIGTNYMFLVQPPMPGTPLDLLPKGGWEYFGGFAIMVLVVFTIATVPWSIANMVAKRKSVTVTE